MGQFTKDDWKATAGIAMVAIALLGMMWVIRETAPVDQWDIPVLQFVSGTEYNIGEAGQVITEARYLNGSSALQSCNFTVWYPDKSVFIVASGGVSASGNQYINFTVPARTGIYEYQAQCVYDNAKLGVISKSFHVSEFQNETTQRLNKTRAVIAG